MSCIPNSRECLRIPKWGISPSHYLGDNFISLDFDGQEIFKRAVKGMGEAIEAVLQKNNVTAEDIDLFIPHQANIRIIQALAKRLDFSMDKVVVCIDKYANTSAAAIPLALNNALDAKRIEPGMTILTASFGAGLTCGAGIIRWADRVTAEGSTKAEIPPYDGTVFDLMADSFRYYGVEACHLLTRGGNN